MDDKLKVGDRFQIEYDSQADPHGVFGYLKTAWFEVVEVTPNGVNIKQVVG